MRRRRSCSRTLPFALWLASVVPSFAALTPAQLQTLKTNLAANTITVTYLGASVQIKDVPSTPDGAIAIAEWYNAIASPDFWVWRTSVFESEYMRASAIDSDGSTVTNWSWTIYINRTQGERDAWARLFMGGGAGANPSLPNVRQGVADIFSGVGGASQRAHLLAVSRRLAKRVEQLFATGTGTAASPAVMGVEGTLSYPDVLTARSLP